MKKTATDKAMDDARSDSNMTETSVDGLIDSLTSESQKLGLYDIDHEELRLWDCTLQDGLDDEDWEEFKQDLEAIRKGSKI